MQISPEEGNIIGNSLARVRGLEWRETSTYLVLGVEVWEDIEGLARRSGIGRRTLYVRRYEGGDGESVVGFACY